MGTLSKIYDTIPEVLFAFLEKSTKVPLTNLLQSASLGANKTGTYRRLWYGVIALESFCGRANRPKHSFACTRAFPLPHFAVPKSCTAFPLAPA